MPQRVTITEKWRDRWFYELPAPLKLLYLYMLDTCDCAGVWETNWPLAEVQCMAKFDPKEAAAAFKGKVQVLPSGNWFIQNFVLVQNRITSIEELDPKMRPHLGAIRRLEKEGLWQGEPSAPVKLTKDVPLDDIPEPEPDGFDVAAGFAEAWGMYPRKLGSKAARKHYIASVKSQKDHDGLISAIKAYAASDAATKDDGKFCKHGSTFFNQWQDYVPVVAVADVDKEAQRQRRAKLAALKFNRDSETGLPLTEEQRIALTKELNA